jgi:hypothetical protein
VSTSGTGLFVVLKGDFLPQNNTHLKNHPWLHCTGEIHRIDYWTILSTYHLIVTLFDEAIANMTTAIAIDDVMGLDQTMI